MKDKEQKISGKERKNPTVLYKRTDKDKRAVNSGSVALEYILVSTMVLFSSIALMTFTLKWAKQSITEYGEKVGIDVSEIFRHNPFIDSDK
ncbi:MAG: hypothetical protein H6618_05570 [Deltaproteobacteria bacterium]|nr:hypothetical protein [Deltaproteobacteria bacterium]